ncbi:MAG: Gfo/Idh/MocA family oxidoreductase [Spirochaetales bacterium]|nr:Gfo/Idh/MocA family oxidoreductase [Spirochaetales bacterium]
MLNVAVVGCGAVSKNHGKALQNNQYATLKYAVDIDRAKAEAFSQTYGGEVLTSHRDLYGKDVDVVHVVTPHFTHPEIVMDLLEQGFNVFCEKPLAISKYDAKKMIKKAEETGKLLGVCFQNRLNKATIEAKEIIDSKRYGSIVSGMALVAWDRHGKYYTDSPWRGTYQGEGGGVIINQAIHTLDLMDYLSGGVKAVSAFDGHLRDTDDYEVEDSAMILFKLLNGATAVGFCTNCYPQSKICDVEFHLEHAVMTVRQSGLTIVEEDGNTIVHKAEVLKGEKSEWGVSHGLLINEFYKSVINRTPFICDCHTGLAAVSIVNAIQHSKGKFIKIDR